MLVIGKLLSIYHIKVVIRSYEIVCGYRTTHVWKIVLHFYHPSHIRQKEVLKNNVSYKLWLKYWYLLQEQNTQYPQPKCYNKINEKMVIFLYVITSHVNKFVQSLHKWALAPFI